MAGRDLPRYRIKASYVLMFQRTHLIELDSNHKLIRNIETLCGYIPLKLTGRHSHYLNLTRRHGHSLDIQHCHISDNSTCNKEPRDLIS